MYTLIFITLFSFILFPFNLNAQEQKTTKIDPNIETEDTPQTFHVIPIAFSTNETGAALGLMYNQVVSNGSDDRPDNIQAYSYYSSKKQYNLSLKPSFYFQDGQHHLTGAIFAAYTPSTFWGTGKDAGDRDINEDFTSTGRGFFIAGTTRINGPYRIGMVLSYNHRKISDEEPGGILVTSNLVGADGGEDVGFGLLGEIDSRDSTFWPTTGEYYKLNGIVHRDGLGSDFHYNEYNLDLRTYYSLNKDSLLAIRFLGSGISGTPPFYALRQLGGSRLLRGLYGGQYRDKWLYSGQIEYRAHLTGRFSWAAFSAIGNISEHADELFDDTPLLTGGAGVRFALDPENRVNLRVDIGVSKHGIAPMVMINEAF